MRILHVSRSLLVIAVLGALLAAAPISSTPVGAASQFDDVPAGSFYAEAVAWLADAGITTGTSETTFSPNDQVTRGQMAAFIERYAQIEGDPGEHGFDDVPAGSFYDGAVTFLVDNEITTGTSETTYSPGGFVTRAQMAAFLYRFSGKPVIEAPMPFDDVPAGTWYYDPVRWLAEEEITTGTSATTYSPAGLVTRAQMATFLWRLAGEPDVGELGVNRFDPDETQVLDEDDVDFDTLDTEGDSELTWTGGDTPSVGQILVFGVSDETPDGFMGRVTSVSGNTVRTSPAVLNDALPNADFTIAEDLSEAETLDPNALSLQGKIDEAIEGSPLTCSTDVELSITPTLDVTPSMVLDASWGLDGPKFEAGLELEVTPTLEGTIGGAISCSTSISVDGPKLKPITFVVGGFPVIIQPEISFEAELYANFAASANPYISYTETVGIIIEYDDEWSVRYPTGDNDGLSMGVDYTGDAVFGVELRARLDLKAYGVVGIYLTLGPFIETTVQFGDPWWSVDVGVRAGAGVTVNLFDWWVDSHHFGSIDLLRYNLAKAAPSDPRPDAFVDVSTLKVTALATGDGHSCAITAADEVACWGRNTRYQVGGGDTFDQPEAVFLDVQSDALPTDIAAGEAHTCAVFADGTVECWGRNDLGQAGQPMSQSNVTEPTPVAGISDARRIVAAGNHTCVLTLDFDVWCWGAGANGQTGQGHFDDTSTPGKVEGLDAVVDIDVSPLHTCVAIADGSAACWGNNGFGEVEFQRSAAAFAEPIEVTGFLAADVKAITGVGAGRGRTCVIYGDTSEVACWGSNSFGKLGTGRSTPTTETTPVNLSIRRVRDLALGDDHSCALLESATATNPNDPTDPLVHTECWGRNTSGQLGDRFTSSGETDDTAELKRARNVDAATSIEAGGAHTCQLTTEGRAQCWGSDFDGQLGDDAAKSSHATPSYVRDPINAL
ncbi:MAG: S-layer homology domain-containing protein [Actinomycetota bacterium]